MLGEQGREAEGRKGEKMGSINCDPPQETNDPSFNKEREQKPEIFSQSFYLALSYYFLSDIFIRNKCSSLNAPQRLKLLDVTYVCHLHGRGATYAVMGEG